MSERDWKEEQRDALTRLFEAAFERREVPEKEVEKTLPVRAEVKDTARPASDGLMAFLKTLPPGE